MEMSEHFIQGEKYWMVRDSHSSLGIASIISRFPEDKNKLPGQQQQLIFIILFYNIKICFTCTNNDFPSMTKEID